jgi:hypothetical protein
VDQTIFALPILPGQAAAARAFLSELEGPRKGQYAASERRLGLTKEVWAIQAGPQGDLYAISFAVVAISINETTARLSVARVASPAPPRLGRAFYSACQTDDAPIAHSKEANDGPATPDR